MLCNWGEQSSGHFGERLMELEAAGAGWTSPKAALSYSMGQFGLELRQRQPFPGSCRGCCRRWLWGNSHNTQVGNCCEQTPTLRSDFRDALHLSDLLHSKGRGKLGSDAQCDAAGAAREAGERRGVGAQGSVERRQRTPRR